MSAAPVSKGPRLHASALRSSSGSSLTPSPQVSPQPRSPGTPLSPFTESQSQSPSATSSYQKLPIEYPPGMAPPRSRIRRHSVSAESDRPSHPVYTRRRIAKSEEQRQRIMAATKSSILFSGLDREQQEEIIDSMEEVKVHAGDSVIRQGEEGDFFYIIDSGTYDVYRADKPPPHSSHASPPPPSPNPSSSSSSSPSASPSAEEKVFEYPGKGSFGELALMYNCPRAATVRARTDGCLWRVDRETFQHIVIASTARKRRLLEGALENVPLLANVSKQERAQVADAMETAIYSEGDYILRQGEVGETIYFVIKGECVATQVVGRGEVEVGRIREGGYFGERSLLTNEARAANVKCASARVEVGQLDRSAFERLLGSMKDVMHRQIQEYRKAEEMDGRGGGEGTAEAKAGEEQKRE